MSGQPSNTINKSVDGVISLKSIYDARKTELAALEKVVTSQGGRKRAFQLLPRHLRRRAMSYNPHLVPRRLRRLAIEQSKDTLSPKDKKKLVKMKRSIKKRKESADVKWMETHMWHAKRFKIASMWGYKIPYESTLRAKRCIYRECRDSALVHDASYVQSISIIGAKMAIYSILEKAFRNKIINITNIHEGLLRNDSDQIIAPVMFHGRLLPDSDRVEVWIWVSAAGFPHALDYFHSINNLQLSIRDQKDWFNRYEVIGPKSSHIISSVLKPFDSEIELKLKSILMSRPRASYSNDLYIINVKDPRILVKRTQNSKDEYHKLTLEEKVSMLPISTAPIPFDASSDIWSLEWLNSDKSLCDIKDHEINQNLVPMGKLLNSGTWVILHKINSNNTLGEGWCLICPKSWGMPFWRTFSTSGIRAIGLREKMDIMFEQSKPRFPYDFPCSEAYNDYQEVREAQESDSWGKKPPAKRVNYEKLGIDMPFKLNWSSLFGVNSDQDIFVMDNIDDSKSDKNALLCVWLSIENKGTVINDFSRVYTREEEPQLVGFVTSGRFSHAHGKVRALAFCKLSTIKEIVQSETQEIPNFAIRLSIKNTTSQYFHDTIAMPARLL